MTQLHSRLLPFIPVRSFHAAAKGGSICRCASRHSVMRSIWLTLISVVLMLQVWLISPGSAAATGVYSLPSLSAEEPTWVIDQAGVMSRSTRGEVSSDLADLAQKTGNEVRFVTIHRLDYGETIDSFTNQLFEKWFPTPEAQANQTLLVLDNVTNSSAIRTGTDVQSLLTPEAAESVSQETVMVPLRNGNKYNQAFLDASVRLTAILSGEADPGPPIVENIVQTEGTFARAEETDDRSATVIVVVLLLLATIIPMATYYIYQAIQS